MNRDSIHYWILLFILVFFIYDQVTVYPQLPERIASHFGAGGRPNGWMGKNAGIIMINGLVFGMVILFWGISWLMPKMPVDFFNMPNKEFYFSETRRASTIRYMQKYMLIFGNLTVAFLVWVNHLVLQANLQSKPALDNSFFYFLGLYLLLIIGSSIRMMIMFYRKQELPDNI